MKTFQLKTAMALELGHMTYTDQSVSFKITVMLLHRVNTTDQ